MWIPQKGVTADVEIRHVSIFFNQVKETYLVERIMVVDSKKSFASSHEHPRAQIFFSLGDMAILMLDKLSLCTAKVIIHSRLRDKFDLVIYYHNMVAT